MPPLSEQNLILTGYTGPNQPAIGRQVAERLQMPFVNTELLVEERTGMSAEELRAQFGESRLKTVEAEILREAGLRRSAVIRVSGRALLSNHHLTQLQATGPVVCLVAGLDAILQQLHLALGARYHNPHQRALALGHLKDEWVIRSLPGVLELDVTYLSEAETVEAVIALWQRVAVRRG